MGEKDRNVAFSNGMIIVRTRLASDSGERGNNSQLKERWKVLTEEYIINVPSSQL